MTRITVVGGGKMGEALLAGIARHANKAESDSQVSLSVVEPDSGRAADLAAQYGIEYYTDITHVADVDLLILAVKPQVVVEVGRELGGQLKENQVVISVAAGATLDFLAKVFGHEAQLVRAMPNTPALVGKGATGLSFSESVTPEVRSAVHEIFRSVGAVVEIDEQFQAAVTSVSGSGPAYFFAFVEALTAGGIQQGLDPETAEILAKQTLIGAAAMLEETGESATILRQNVTSPHGTTQAALKSLAASGLTAVVAKAEVAAADRQQEMTKELLDQLDS